MADWYASSAAYAAVTQWAATTVYTVGQLRRSLAAPASTQNWVFRCTTAGTSAGTEPTWTTASANNATKTDGTVTWTNVTGQSTYGWSAAAGTVLTISNSSSGRSLVGDRVFVSSDSSETVAAASYAVNNGSNAYGLVQHISVNRAGSVPPVAADILSGASIVCTGVLTFETACDVFWQGFSFSSGASLTFNSSRSKNFSFKNCAFVLTGVASTKFTNASVARVIWDNCTVQFSVVGQSIGGGGFAFDLIWIGTASAIVGATLPTALVTSQNATHALLTLRGVDLSAYTGTLLQESLNAGASRVLLDSCKISSSMTRLGAHNNVNYNLSDEVELVNCFDGTNVLNERYTAAGTVTTDRSTYLTGGAQDDIGNYSLKLVTGTNVDKFVLTLDSFWLDVENTATGSSKTATVEIISSSSLNDDDISLLLEYMGTSGNPIASFASSLPAVLTTGSALTTSSVTWNNPPATPQKQKLQVTFTPQRAGRVRGLVRLGKISTTVWVNPQVTIT